ncbi:MAG: hypothetical protein A2096_01215 [Spirochaetes bacterium GWF1_41_5]|nr:MAG: hypothetical protein A2096_01215 [Spirochaetes bacterium GWF1_41_5]HBE04691.1 hypothetical protein [Spirochaetia bacterium]
MKYFVLGDEDTVLAFSLAGVYGQAVGNPEEADRAFTAVISDKNAGIIIITERIADLIRSRVDQYIFSSHFPLILEIPDRLGKMEGKPGIREMVNRAIGITL